MNRKISFQSLMFLKLTGTSCRGSLLYPGYDFGTVFKIFSIQFFGGKFYPKICCSNCPWIHFHLLIFILIFFHYVLFHYHRLITINMLSNCLDESIFIEITHIMSVPLKLCLEKCPVNVFNSNSVVLISPKMSFNRSPYKVKSHTTKIISNYDIWPLFCCWSVSCM